MGILSWFESGLSFCVNIITLIHFIKVIPSVKYVCYILQMILTFQADETPLAWALGKNYGKIVSLLIQSGADVNLAKWVSNKTFIIAQSLWNRSFGGIFGVVTLLFGFFCGCRGFCHRTESDLLLFSFIHTTACVGAFVIGLSLIFSFFSCLHTTPCIMLGIHMRWWGLTNIGKVSRDVHSA